MSSQHTKNYLRLTLLRLVLLITVITIVITVMVLNNRSEPPKKIPTAVVKPVNINKPLLITSLPIRLNIQSINVDAAIDYTGLTPDGAMEVKKDTERVSWYSIGPRPGEIGSAVIAGHYGWFNGKGSVFNKLQNLKKGDEVLVIDEKNVTNYFIVRESHKYNPDANAPEVFTSSDNKSHLNLVTCNGTWDEAKQTYSNRLVIFTDKKI